MSRSFSLVGEHVSGWWPNISFDENFILAKVLVIEYWLWVVDVKFVSTFHKEFFASDKIGRLFDFILTEGKLLECVSYYLKYALCEHRVAGFIEVIRAHVEDA